MIEELKEKEVNIIESFRPHIKNSNIQYFKDNKQDITPFNIHHLLDMCVFSNNEEVFDYLLTFDFADVGYDDCVLFNYAIELGNYNFATKLAKYPEIDICNDDCWIVKYTVNNKFEAIDFILSFEEVLNNITDEWIEENIYTDDDSVHLFKEKLQLHRKKINIKNF
tara:strand:+ start:2893 stop:3390 length:498 start_codon:yes stop_codon:yes gene_type:complete